jgi:hypothetical protein
VEDLGYKVKTIDGLHAKIYCSSSAVIVGSSNASRNGLQYEADQMSGNIEANVLIRDPKFVQRVSAWFDDYWKSKLATAVDVDLISEARPLFIRNSQASRQGTPGLVDRLRSDSKLIKKIKANVIFYMDEDVSPEATKTYDLEAAASYSEADRRANGGGCPFYEDKTNNWVVKPETIFLDFTVPSQGKRPSFGGIWQVRPGNFSVPVPNVEYPEHRIILTDRLIDIRGTRISKSDERVFGQAIKSFMDKRGKPWKEPDARSNYNYFEVSFSQFWNDMVLPSI